jgi:hypothetical protein
MLVECVPLWCGLGTVQRQVLLRLCQEQSAMLCECAGGPLWSGLGLCLSPAVVCPVSPPPRVPLVPLQREGPCVHVQQLLHRQPAMGLGVWACQHLNWGEGVVVAL